MRKQYRSFTVHPADAYDREKVLPSWEAICDRSPGKNRTRHHTLYGLAQLLAYEEYEDEEMYPLLRDWLIDAGREPQEGEIEATIAAIRGQDGGYHVYQRKPSGPTADKRLVVKLYKKYGGYSDLVEYLGIPGNEDILKTTTAEWLKRHYAPDDLLCIGEDTYATEILPARTWIAAHMQCPFALVRATARRYCLLTPATYREKVYVDEKGGKHGRCDVNVLNRRYFVLECDIAEKDKGKETTWTKTLKKEKCTGFDLQAGVIRHLFESGWPIVSIVHSGNKSLHVWCSGKAYTNEEEVNLQIRNTGSLGFDIKAGQIPSQFFRLPNPNHPDRPQCLLYLNPEFINL